MNAARTWSASAAQTDPAVPAASTALPRALAGVRNLTISALRLAGRADVTAADNHRRRLLPRHVRAPPAGPPQPPREAARLLRADAHGGKLDPAAVEAVLTSAGHPTRRPAVGPAGLTQREVQVLVLLARAATTRQIARRLGITPKAAGNHIERIYTKIGASTRAAAALYAIQHGLLQTLEPLE